MPDGTEMLRLLVCVGPSVTITGVMLEPMPPEADAVRVTCPAKPFKGTTVMAEEEPPPVPASKVREVGLSATLKSGVGCASKPAAGSGALSPPGPLVGSVGGGTCTAAEPAHLMPVECSARQGDAQASAKARKRTRLLISAERWHGKMAFCGPSQTDSRRNNRSESGASLRQEVAHHSEQSQYITEELRCQ